jgi:hypothetical protein
VFCNVTINKQRDNEALSLISINYRSRIISVIFSLFTYNHVPDICFAESYVDACNDLCCNLDKMFEASHEARCLKRKSDRVSTSFIWQHKGQLMRVLSELDFFYIESHKVSLKSIRFIS